MGNPEEEPRRSQWGSRCRCRHEEEGRQPPQGSSAAPAEVGQAELREGRRWRQAEGVGG